MTELTSIQRQDDHQDPMVQMIARVAMDANIPLDRLNALMDMRERQMNKQAEQNFNRAFAAAMAEMPSIPKNGKGNKSKYSTLNDLVAVTRPILSRHGLSLNWQTVMDGDVISVTAIVRHADGHSISTTLTGARDIEAGGGKAMNKLQAGGSTETYLKRYSGFSILGLSSGDEVDNDGAGEKPRATITAEQFVLLREKIEQAGITEQIVCTAEKIDILQELPAAKFAAVCAKLDTTIKNKLGAAQ